MFSTFSIASMSESRPRELTSTDLAAMDVGAQTSEAMPVQLPPLGSLAATAEILDKQSRPSDTLLTAQGSGSIAADIHPAGPKKSRG